MNIISLDNLKSFIKDKKGETTLFQTNIIKSRLTVLKTIPRDKIRLPDSWVLNYCSSKQGA